jgi:GNAT superfamily N-acetyltransferase
MPTEVTAAAPVGYSIRRRRPDDDATLLQIENRAAQLFRAHNYPSVADAPIPDVAWLRAMIEGQEVWVAVDGSDAPVGFAVAGEAAGFLHLRELSVDPAHGRKGLGRALVLAVHGTAKAAGLAGTSLTTFRDVPFNAPFYAGLGFSELPPSEAPVRLAGILLAEVPDGVPAKKRVLMIRRV